MWVVGIDEAGYGPNLGPLVQAAAAVRLPGHDPAGWDTLKGCVRRSTEKADGRVLVDDSKKVNVGPRGLAKLECGLAALAGLPAGTLGEWLAAVALAGVLDELRGEAWFEPAELVPLHPDPVPDVRHHLTECGVEVRLLGVKLMPAPLFNKVVNGSGTKATPLAVGLQQLLAAAHESLPAGEPLLVICDKQGGRHFYAPVLQAVFCEGWVVAEAEGADESRYRVEGLGREVRVVVRPRADASGVAVALASMACKYLREVCMRQFNRYWAARVPGLRPTAGYPVDARRFFDAIRPAMAAAGVSDEQVWRVK